MVATLEILSQKSLVVVLAYAPTGLGHLRVTDALFHGLPKSSAPLLLGSQDKSIGILHRIASIHPAARFLMERTQTGISETIFTLFYRHFLSTRTDILYSQLTTILDQRVTMPRSILVVSTHFGLAYELSLIKKRLEKEKDVQIILVVVVTDDSPQQLWYIPLADLTFVPSQRTKERLTAYGKISKLPDIRIEVIPYPVSPGFSLSSSNHHYADKKSQVDFNNHKPIHISIPISGAAVGTSQIMNIISILHAMSSRFKFHIIVKNAPFTREFIGDMMAQPNTVMYTSMHDRELIDLYETIYNKYPIAFEITKPSEQAFKALLEPKHIGGVILLFVTPVGRQEYDNLAFLRRHKLIPAKFQQKWLEYKCKHDLKFTDHEKQTVLSQAHFWRGIQLPQDPVLAARFVTWCLEQGIFERMFDYIPQTIHTDSHIEEVSPNGVALFWQKVAEFMSRIS